MQWLRCVFLRTTRAAIECGPHSSGQEYMGGTRVLDCHFADFDNLDEPGALLPISLVAQAAEDTQVKNNYVDRGMGPTAKGTANPGIEFTGSGSCEGNVIKNHAWAGFTYQSGWHVGDNVYWVQAGEPRYSDRPDGWTNNGHGSGTYADNPTPSSEPPVKPHPERVSSALYYRVNDTQQTQAQ